MRYLACLSFALFLVPSAASSTSVPKALYGVNYYDPLQHSHVVIRGKVLASHTERSERLGWDAPWVSSNVTIVRVTVAELLGGNWPGTEIEMAAIGGVSSYFEVGKEYIFCCMSKNTNGADVLLTDTGVGLYARQDEAWSRIVFDDVLDTNELLSDAELRTRVASASLVSMTRSSDIIARGVILDSRRSKHKSPNGAVCSLMHYRVKVSEFIKGKTADNELEFVIPRVGGSDYVPAWYRVTPSRIENGQEWVIFLRRGEFGLYPFGGRNSLLRVEGERLIYDNAIEYPRGLAEAMDVIRVEVRDEG